MIPEESQFIHAVIALLLARLDMTKKRTSLIWLSNAKIQGIFANGGKAHQLFVKYCNKEGMPPLGKLPSTSPANAAWNLERLTAEWKTAFGMYLEITE